MPVNRAITKLLIANRGEIAARIIRTAHALGIATVAVYSDPDADAPYVTLADEAVRLPGAAPADTYLRGDLIIAAAAATGAGRGPPRLRVPVGERRVRAGLRRRRADLRRPRARNHRGDGRQGRGQGRSWPRPACPCCPARPSPTTTDLDQFPPRRAEVGFPLLVKAAFGGGGRGMRLVAGPAELAEAVSSARREAASAFGDGTVFLERFVTDPRHVEVQILGDAHGDVVHLFERECSIQRRYQKIVEECPSPAVDDDLRDALTAAAVAAGWAIGYTGAGTVEFVLDRDGALLLPGDEHPAAGRAPGHRGGHRPGPGGAAAADRRGRAAAGVGPRRRGSAATRSRSGCTPRTSPRDSSPRPGPCTASPSRRPRASGSTPASATARWSARTTTRCWPRSSRTAPPGPTRRGGWPARSARPGSTA